MARSDGSGNFQVTLEDMQLGGMESPSVVSEFDRRLMELARQCLAEDSSGKGVITLKVNVARVGGEGSSELTLSPDVKVTPPAMKKRGFVATLGSDGLTQRKQLSIGDMTKVTDISSRKGS